MSSLHVSRAELRGQAPFSRAAIEGTGTCAEPGAGSRDLAIRAANLALAQAGRRPEDIELLVNTGIYRDENIIEPAMGPFIQRGIGANPSFSPGRAAGTFSFDLANGVGGLLTGIRVVDGFMRSGAVRSGMVVASDADPDPSRSENYAFAAAGGAILLRAASSGEGFAWFHARTWSEHFSLFESRLCGTEDIPLVADRRSAQHQRLRIYEHGDFLDRLADCACATVDDAVSRGILDEGTIDLVIPAPRTAGFAAAIAARLGLPAPVEDRDAALAPTVHTASTAFSLASAWQDGSWDRARRILFVAAGAGVTVNLALYERALVEPALGEGAPAERDPEATSRRAST